MQQGWDNFYYLIGSAAGGLIGLLFVVMTLTAGRDRSGIQRGAGLYMTPTVLHFASVLSISAVSLAPGLPDLARAMVFGFFALAGLAAAVRAVVGISRPRPDRRKRALAGNGGHDVAVLGRQRAEHRRAGRGHVELRGLHFRQG